MFIRVILCGSENILLIQLWGRAAGSSFMPGVQLSDVDAFMLQRWPLTWKHNGYCVRLPIGNSSPVAWLWPSLKVNNEERVAHQILDIKSYSEWKSSLLPFRLSSWLLCLSPFSFPPAPLGFNWILMVALLLSVARPILIYIPLPLLMFRPSCRLTADAEHRQLWLKRRGQSNSVSRFGTAEQSQKTNQVNWSFGIHLYGGQINPCSLSSTAYSKCYILCKHCRKFLFFYI